MKFEYNETVHLIPIDKISSDPNQPRKYFNEEEEKKLAKSIQKHGLIQPIIVRSVNQSDKYIIVTGERRYRAHKRLGIKRIKAIIREMKDSEARDLQLLENIQRSDLSDIELAWEFQQRADAGQTHQQIATVIGRNRTYVTQRLSLLKLSDIDQQRMLRRELSFSQARVLVSVMDPEERRKISSKMKKDVTVKRLQNEIRGEPKNTVTRVTSKSSVYVENLAVYKFLSDEDGRLKKVVLRGQLIAAYLADLKMLR